MHEQQEKKVEYIELVYDLIFVYLIGRSNSLLDCIEAGFISGSTFMNYLLSSLIILQIWYSTSIFINRFGRNGLAEKLMIFVNMFLLYIMGSNTINGWDINYSAYMTAWSLILLNLALQYALKLRVAESDREKKFIRQNIAVLLLHSALIAISIPVYLHTGKPLGQWTLLIGFAAIPFIVKVPVNFEHLSERMMLYVVFTFGEMIIAVADYFSDGLSLETLYFALVSFLVVAGLFFSYGYLYDKLLDRKREDTGSLYALLHVFLIISLSVTTIALDFMRDESVDSMPKTIMLLVSLLAYYACLALTEHWSVRRFRKRGSFLLLLGAEYAAFAVAVLINAGSGYVVGALLVMFVYVQLFMLLHSKTVAGRR